ncbi:acid protease [Leucogyrophana mollusca]|uniref:Acid protease n=1 Tax=Leucogyrophana mollusca TaxID=85980 RepID=A0ACB8BLG5_9AGAM|nr:acid protease [Leucogyrophana mollusca]
MLWSASLVSLVLLLSSLEVFGAPSPSPGAGQSISLSRRTRSRNATELAQLAQKQRLTLAAKYNAQSRQKRSTGYNLLIDQDSDSGYIGSLAIGTPAVSYEVLLDTGSSDLWVAGSSCAACGSSPSFNPVSSTSFQNLSTPFAIQYGSGEAEGYLGQDVVQMAGFSVSNQGFAVVDATSQDLLQSPVSGLLGLAWQAIASSGKTPFWQTLASSNAWDSPLMSIQLRRYGNDTSAQTEEPGGTLMMGYVNSSLYTGDIDYQDIPGTPGFWSLTLSSITAQGTSVSLGDTTLAAIDTGTTNIAGPTSSIEAIYATIPGSQPATGEWEGYYSYPCDTDVSVSFSFGGPSWSMSSADFEFTRLENSADCIGAFFGTDTGGNGNPYWIIGDAFLKNVYSVFRYNPASVGFAALSETALSMNGVDGTVPTPTIGAVTAAVTGAALPNYALSKFALIGSTALVAFLL